MENFKTNDYNTKGQDKRSLEQENNFEEFQNLNLDSLESLDPARQEKIEDAQESLKKEPIENLYNIYAQT